MDHHRRTNLLATAIMMLLGHTATSFSIVPSPSSHHHHHHQLHRISNDARASLLTTRLHASSLDDDIAAQLAKSKQLLEQAKAKVAAAAAAAAEAEASGEADVVSVAEPTAEASAEKSSKRDSVTKSKNDDTGLITTDGELMAELSELEEWEMRSLLDVFESESKEESEISKQLGKRDVARSIQAMRIRMHDGDFRRIFDKRNRFIGEDN